MAKTLASPSKQPFRKQDSAVLVAKILRRMTGDDCVVYQNSVQSYYVLRETGSGRVRG